MSRSTPRIILVFSCLLFPLLSTAALATSDPLPFWNDGPSKNVISAFVKAVTDKSGSDYVQPSERIAVFDTMVLFG